MMASYFPLEMVFPQQFDADRTRGMEFSNTYGTHLLQGHLPNRYGGKIGKIFGVCW